MLHALVRATTPAKTGRTTIQADRPWEELGVSVGSIVQVGEQYRLYYAARYKYPDSNEPSRRLCLAVSQDGFYWEKPSLGLVAFNGSKENNIVFPVEESWFSGGMVFRDNRPDVGDNAQYKMICRWSPPGFAKEQVAEWVLKSSDGLRWSRMSDGPSYRHSDTFLSGFWDSTGAMIKGDSVTERSGQSWRCRSRAPRR